jgi:hypothetical protein
LAPRYAITIEITIASGAPIDYYDQDVNHSLG